MGLFDRFRRREHRPNVPGPSAEGLADLRQFLTSRAGVEAYLEPRTNVYALSLCLVAADGEYIRRPVKDEQQAQKLASAHGVPLYEARRVGYPKRMRDYDRGQRQPGIDVTDLPPLEVTKDPKDD